MKKPVITLSRLFTLVKHVDSRESPETLLWLQENSLLEKLGEDYYVTEKGRIYLAYIQTIPLPISTYVIPERE